MAEYSPMMQHYLDTKNKYNDSILFYRLGDFYEMFFDDAKTVSRELELTLTGKDCGQEERAPMCGIPFHAAENYIAKLISKGYKVAICEQLEDPKQAKGIVKRDVIRVVTPGTVMEANLLEEKKNNYIMSIFKTGIYFGIAVCDISTGDFYASEIKETNNFPKLLDEISRFTPAEIIVNEMMSSSSQEIGKIKERFDTYISNEKDANFLDEQDDLFFSYQFFNENSEKIKDIKDKKIMVCAVKGLLKYLTDTQKTSLDHIHKITVYETTKYMALDINARRNLELTEKMRDKSKRGTLLWVLDKTSTSMGGRLLRRWISDPLIDEKEINKRLDAVEELKNNIILRGEIVEVLKKVYDMERLSAKIAYGSANGRDLISLKNSAKQLPEIKELLKNSESKEGKNWIINLEAEERNKTGIKGLKVGFNKVFGYFIEVTKSNLSMVPDRFIRKQTLANCERYITEELKNLENQILGAEEKVVTLEYNTFVEIRDKIEGKLQRIQKSASIIACLDVLCSLSQVAEDFNYCKPQVTDDGVLEIKDGRHPVIEKMISSGSFVQNDTFLNTTTDRLAIITGPNMAGKSTYMRQVALITLMAQIGSFVPASFAKIGIVDKIFTRVGASDDLSMGQSTFMVEMMEVASILRDATKKSLVILDEIGRGTSTYDGLSIAWAVAEYISDKEKCGAKTLFATHYHELTELENKLEGVKNYSIAVKEKGEDIIFLRKIVEGGTDESYGVHVAKLAGVPQVVTKRANEILKGLERKNLLNQKVIEKENKKVVNGQFDMFDFKLAEIAHEIDKINVNELTPIEALNTLMKIKEKMSE